MKAINTSKVISIAAMLFAISSPAGAVTKECMNFQSFTAGVAHPVGTTFSFNTMVGDLVPFQWSNGQWTSGGSGQVVASNYARGSGQEANLNNINLNYTFTGPKPFVASFRYADYGGNINLGVNGVVSNVQDLSSLNNRFIGGVFVLVTRQNLPTGNNHYGKVTLIGAMDDFGVGGQEFWVDDVCAYFQ